MQVYGRESERKRAGIWNGVRGERADKWRVIVRGKGQVYER